MEQSQAGQVFKKARMRLHRIIGRMNPISRAGLAQMALEKYGPIRTPRTCRRDIDEPEPINRWIAKIQALERAPGERSLCDEHAYQLCELLHIKRPDDREELDLGEALLQEAA